MSRTIISLALGALLGVSFAGSSDTTSELKMTLQHRYEQYTKAYLTKNLKLAGQIFAVDYFGGSALHPLDKKKTLKMLQQSNGVFRTTSRRIQSVKRHGFMVNVIVDNVTVGHFNGKTKHVYVIKSTNSDDWVKNAIGWQLKRSYSLRSSTTEDGKPYVPNGKPRKG